jgi:hypothetical protein
LRLAKSALEEQLGGLRAKLALEKSLRAMLDGNGSSSVDDGEEDSDENETKN